MEERQLQSPADVSLEEKPEMCLTVCESDASSEKESCSDKGSSAFLYTGSDVWGGGGISMLGKPTSQGGKVKAPFMSLPL